MPRHARPVRSDHGTVQLNDQWRMFGRLVGERNPLPPRLCSNSSRAAAAADTGGPTVLRGSTNQPCTPRPCRPTQERHRRRPHRK